MGLSEVMFFFVLLVIGFVVGRLVYRKRHPESPPTTKPGGAAPGDGTPPRQK